MPASLSALQIIRAPRSCPSSPNLETRTLIGLCLLIVPCEDIYQLYRYSVLNFLQSFTHAHKWIKNFKRYPKLVMDTTKLKQYLPSNILLNYTKNNIRLVLDRFRSYMQKDYLRCQLRRCFTLKKTIRIWFVFVSTF